MKAVGASQKLANCYEWLLGALATSIALVATADGLGLSPDSTLYLSTAQNLINSWQLTPFTGEPLTVFPPGLPLIGAVGGWLGVGVERFLRFVITSSVGFTVVAFNRLIREVNVRRSIEFSSTALLAVSPTLAEVGVMAWTEAPFMLVSTLVLLVGQRLWREQNLSFSRILQLTTCCLLAFGLRYAGLAAIAATLVIAALARLQRDRRMVTRWGVLVAGLVGPPSAWVARNLAADGTAFGPRYPSLDSITETVKRVAATALRWFVPVELDGWLGGAALTCVMLMGVSAATAAAVAWPELVRRVSRRRLMRSALWPALVTLAVYVSYIVVAQLSTAIDPIGRRLLAPAIVPAAVCVAIATSRTLDAGAAQFWSKWAARVLGLSFAVQTLLVLGATVELIGRWSDEGVGSITRTTKASELAVAVQVAKMQPRWSDAVVMSNSPYSLWAAVSVQPIITAPETRPYRSLPTEDGLVDFRDWLSCHRNGVLVALFEQGSDRFYAIEDLSTVAIVERISVTPDGSLYWMTAVDDATRTACRS